MSDAHDLDLSDAEKDALHEVQLGTEHVHEALGHLIQFHHATGRAMDRFADAEELLREADREKFAEELRTDHLPAGAIDDMWTYELVENYRQGFLTTMLDFDSRVREDLCDGLEHVTEREQQRRWRERGGWYEDGEGGEGDEKNEE